MPKSKKQATGESAAESPATEKKQASAADIYGWEQVQTEAKPKRGRPRKVAAPEEKPAPGPTRQKKAESQAREKKPKAAAKPAATEADEPADLVVFAFRVTQAEREEIHNAAGPAKASRFVRTVVLAAARRDMAAIKTAMSQVSVS